MNFSLCKLLGKRGEKIKTPKAIKPVYLDLTKQIATVFHTDTHKLIDTLHVLSVEIHADGIFLKGFEIDALERATYQEYFIGWDLSGK